MENIALTAPPVWIFGYGSLIWNPEFTPARKEIAHLEGYKRSFCMWSWFYRGTKNAPGLVLALDAEKGAHCTGVGLKVRANEAETVLEALRKRELVSSAYRERLLPVRLESGETVKAICYVVDKNHEQYCAHLSTDEQAEIITHAKGARGKNAEYLYQTVDYLDTLGIKDESLFELAARVRNIELEKTRPLGLSAQ